METPSKLGQSRAVCGLLIVVLVLGCSKDVSTPGRAAPTTSTTKKSAPAPMDTKRASATKEPVDPAIPSLGSETEPMPDEEIPEDEVPPVTPEPEPNPTLDESVLLVEREGLIRLSPEFNVWADKQNKQIVLAGEVIRQEGPLEVFICLKNYKEHESVIRVYSQAWHIHAGFLAMGIKPGSTVKYQPEFSPPSGPEIEVTVLWKDSEGTVQRARGQDWVRRTGTEDVLEGRWVFAGSGFWEDPETKQRNYMAEDGEIVCVANFASAMIDVAFESSGQNAELLYEAFQGRIPEPGTKVTVLLRPKPPADEPK